MRISWPYHCQWSMQILRLAFLCRNSGWKRSGTRGALMSNVTQRPFRFLIVQQKTVLQIKDFAIGNAIYVKLLFQFTGYSWDGKQSHTELRIYGDSRIQVYLKSGLFTSTVHSLNVKVEYGAHQYAILLEILMFHCRSSLQWQTQEAPLSQVHGFSYLLPWKIICLSSFKYKYLLQVSMKKCGESVVERRFLLLGKIWTKSRSAHEFSYGFLPASAKFTFDVIDGTKCK